MQTNSLTASPTALTTGADTLRRTLHQALFTLRRLASSLAAQTRRVADPVADCVREAAAVRREALRLMERHPGVAAEWLAAADRHEREGGTAR